MSTTLIDIHELATRLEEALALASAGNEVVLTDGATPRARLVPCPPPAQRIAGLHPKAMEPSDDFDARLPDDFWTGRP